MKRRSAAKPEPAASDLKMFLVPCSCGSVFPVAADYDRHSTALSRYLRCPHCDKRHDPKNRLLQFGYHRANYRTVDDC